MTISETSREELDGVLASASVAAEKWAQSSEVSRAAALDAIAAALEAAAAKLVPIAEKETHLAAGRLQFELRRTVFQLRLFAEVLVDGSYLDVRIDPADPEWPMGAPRPDLRRVLEPLGPALVFAASNFPF